MKTLEPDYYSKFHCASSACPDTCCTAWEVILDEQTRKAYEVMPGEFGVRVRNSISFHDGVWMMRTQNGRCPMLTKEGLCEIQIHGSHEDLCKTCQEYPKFVSEYGMLQERGLSLSCPEACRMILSHAEPIRLISGENNMPLNGLHSLDAEVFLYLQNARRQALAAAQDRSIPVPQRAASILVFSQRLQKNIDCRCFSDIPLVANTIYYPYHPAVIHRTLRKWLHTMLQWEPLPHGTWQKRVAHAIDSLCELPEHKNVNPIVAEQILVYYVYKFFLRGAYHNDVLTQAKFICYCFGVLMTMLRLENAQSLASQVDLVHSFARELEHSAPNIHALYRRCDALHSFSEDAFLPILFYLSR